MYINPETEIARLAFKISGPSDPYKTIS